MIFQEIIIRFIRETTWNIQICRIKVRIGATNRNQDSNVLEVDVVKVVPKEDYQPDLDYFHDIALLKLEKGFEGILISKTNLLGVMLWNSFISN